MLRLIDGLEFLIPNVKFKGDLRENNERMYEALTIIEPIVAKPTYSEVYQAALNVYMKSITNIVDDKTSYNIAYGFSFSEDVSGNKFKADLQWQFNIQTLFAMRNTLTYPYHLKINSDDRGMPIYFTIEDASQFERLYTELFTYINTWLYTGWQEKTKISLMTETELDNYEDLRK